LDNKEKLKERKERLLKFIKIKKNYLAYIILAIIIAIGSYIRTRNLPLLQGKFPIALDPFLFLRYVKTIATNGSLMALDTMRYAPLGYDTSGENILVAYIIVYIYKVIHFFNSSITIIEVDIIYPVIAFAIAMIFFFLLIKRLFDTKTSLIASAFLAVLPTFLYRTMSGFSEKEPIGILFMFLAFYLYVRGWQSKKNSSRILFGSLSGISTGLMGLVWGGVQYTLVIIPVFVLIEYFVDKFENKDYYVYTSWVIFLILILTNLTGRYTLKGILASTSTSFTILALFVLTINYLIINKYPNLKKNIEKRIPFSLFTLLISGFLGAIGLSIIFGPSFLISNFYDLFDRLLNPIGTSRFISTVAEAHQPYFLTWLSQFHKYFYMFIAGSIILFYNTIKPIKKYKIQLTILYTLFIISFIYSRYSPESTFNGTNFISKLFYIGSLLLFMGILITIYLYSFYKEKSILEEIKKLDPKYTFVFIWFLASVVAARGAIRLFFILSPITAVLTGYLIKNVYDFIFRTKNKWLIISGWMLIILIILAPSNIFSLDTHGSLLSFTKESTQQATYTGPSFNTQWQTAMEWVQKNTPEDAIFAHWWDYGYWVQTGGNRTTITDGGNAIGYWNHLMGRLVLTGKNSTQALEFLKTHEATHLLIIADEIGKYPAYASIGSDQSFDRYSSIPLTTANPQDIQETRDGMVYLFRTGVALDEDLIYNDKLYPRDQAAVAGIILPVKIIEDQQYSLGQPTAIIIYNNQRTDIPMQCLFTNNQELIFENYGIESCLMLIPYIDGDGQANLIRSGLYISPKVKNTLFTQMFLFEKEWNGFKLVYNDAKSSNNQLIFYAPQGRIVGPLKIWEINPPSNIQIKPEYLQTTYPKDVLS